MPRSPGKKRKQLQLSKQLQRQFMAVIKKRGALYAKQQRVRILKKDEKHITAEVMGTRPYRVTIDWEGEELSRLKTSCTCPFFRQGIPCKHLWATILVADNMDWAVASSDPEIKDPFDLFSPEFWTENPKHQNQQNSTLKPQTFVLWYTLLRNSMGYFITVQERYIKKNGGFGRVRPLKTRSGRGQRLMVQDRLIIPLIEDAASRNSIYSRSYYAAGRENIPLSSQDLEAILPILAETGRCNVVDEISKIEIPLLRLPSNPLARLKLKVHETGEDKDRVKLSPEIILYSLDHIQDHAIEACTISINDPELFFDTIPLFFIYGSELFQIHGPKLSAIKAMKKLIHQKNGLNLKRSTLPELLEWEEKTGIQGTLDISEEIAPKRIENELPKLKLIIEIEGDHITAEPFFIYGPHEIASSSDQTQILDTNSWVLIQRNFNAEQELLDMVRKHGIDLNINSIQIPLSHATELLDRLDQQGVILQTRERKPFIPGKVSRFTIRSGIDWFDLDGTIEFHGESISLPEMVEAYLKGSRTIQLNSEQIGILPSRWIENHLALLKMADRGSGHEKSLRYHSSQALLLDALLQEDSGTGESGNIEIDNRFENHVKRLKSFDGIRPIPAPKGFRGRLRPYQMEALGWFRFLEQMEFGGILADDMGLGKTVQILAWLCSRPGKRKDSPSLVVAPTSLIFNWINEAKKFTPDLKVLSYTGTDRKTNLEEFSDHHLIITSYGIMRRDIEVLKEIRFNYLILDESQAIKNPDSVAAKAARLLDGAHRLCLTGTPLENHVGELWSQMAFLNPGLLGSRNQFFNNYVKPINNEDQQALSMLQTLVKPFVLRRTKEEVAAELPSKVEKLILCPMTEEQEQVYATIRDHYRQEITESINQVGTNRTRFKVLEGLLRLRQAANHPGLVGADAPSGKFNRLICLIEETLATGHKALIFSQFTRMLGFIKEELDSKGISYEYLDGKVPQKDREARVSRFQMNEEAPLFLISLKAGGLGLNLTAADYVFIVDPWWNPAVELQAIDRSHRIGQKKTVVTYRLISSNTVEEKVTRLQDKKKKIAGSVLSGSKDMISRLSPEDLAILFS